MKVRAVFGNPYEDRLLRVAWHQGREDRRVAGCRRLCYGSSSRTGFAYQRGYERTGWHRSPNGQVKWHRGSA